LTTQRFVAVDPWWHHARGPAACLSAAAWTPVRNAQSAALLDPESDSKKSRQTQMSMKLKRDPAKPKKAQSAWLHFVAEFRQLEQHPPKLVLQKAAETWKALTDKSKYEDLAAKDMAKYEKEREAYARTGAEAAWKRPPGKPKRPLTGFLRFASEYRVKHPTLKMTESMKAASAEWKSMSDSDKLPYNNAFKEEMEKYKLELIAYKATGEEDLWKETVGISAGLAKVAAAKAKASAVKAQEKAKERVQIARLQQRAAKLAMKEAATAKKAAGKGKAKEPSKVVTRAMAALAKEAAKSAAMKAHVLTAAAKAATTKAKAKAKMA